MDVRILRYFVAVLDCGSLTKAASQLNVAQPALSAQIARLENELGMKLLVRHSRGVKATAEGEELRKLASELLRNYVNLQQRMREIKDTKPARVVVGMTPGTYNIIGEELISRAARCIPAINITIVDGFSSMLAEWLSIDKIDVAIIYDPREEIRGVRSEPLLRDQLFAIGIPTMFPSGIEDIVFREIAAFPLVLPGLKTDVLVRTLLQTAAKEHVSLNVNIEVQSAAALREYVLSGHYATIVGPGIHLKDVEAGLLRAIKIVDPQIYREMHFAYSDRRNLTRAEWTLRRLVHEIALERAHNQPLFWEVSPRSGLRHLTPLPESPSDR